MITNDLSAPPSIVLSEFIKVINELYLHVKRCHLLFKHRRVQVCSATCAFWTATFSIVWSLSSCWRAAGSISSSIPTQTDRCRNTISYAYSYWVFMHSYQGLYIKKNHKFSKITSKRIYYIYRECRQSIRSPVISFARSGSISSTSEKSFSPSPSVSSASDKSLTSVSSTFCLKRKQDKHYYKLFNVHSFIHTGSYIIFYYVYLKRKGNG